MQRYLSIVMLLLLSCNRQQKQPSASGLDTATVKAKLKMGLAKPAAEREEFLVDSTDIGNKTHNKFELSKYANTDTAYVIIKFYAKQGHQWLIRNEFHFPKDDFLDCDPQIEDFNHDKLNDVTYVSAVAARAVNVVRNLFIYDKQNDKLIYIKNSEDYPNMLYNKELNCIDALLVSGCWETWFLKIQQDSLHKFARVSLCDSLTVSTYDQQGREKTIMRKKKTYDDFTRFKNYRPLRVY